MARSLTADQFRTRLWEVIDRAGGQKKLAKQLGISPGYLNDVLHDRKPPGESILKALGLRRLVRYVPMDDDE